MGLRSFAPMVTACPGCGRTTSTVFQELAERIQAYLRAQMPAWRARYPGVETMQVAVMGCVVNGPGESKLANIGISLPGHRRVPRGAGVRRRREDRDAAGASASPRSSSGSSTTTSARPTAASRAPRTSRPSGRSIAVEGAGLSRDGDDAQRRPRHERRAARRGGALGALRGRRARRVRAVRIPEHARADRRGDAAVRARHRRRDRHRRERRCTRSRTS